MLARMIDPQMVLLSELGYECKKLDREKLRTASSMALAKSILASPPTIEEVEKRVLEVVREATNNALWHFDLRHMQSEERDLFKHARRILGTEAKPSTLRKFHEVLKERFGSDLEELRDDADPGFRDMEDPIERIDLKHSQRAFRVMKAMEEVFSAIKDWVDIEQPTTKGRGGTDDYFQQSFLPGMRDTWRKATGRKDRASVDFVTFVKTSFDAFGLTELEEYARHKNPEGDGIDRSWLVDRLNWFNR